ncbi:MAG: hypothetical protein GF334_08730 [Candidatus Altiarchaeales archaeon]|nr:hypothetical protein [Candidatus Altiarchaeales archaeon]
MIICVKLENREKKLEFLLDVLARCEGFRLCNEGNPVTYWIDVPEDVTVESIRNIEVVVDAVESSITQPELYSWHTIRR